MLRIVQRLNHRNAVQGNLDALLLMYPRKRQFARDFPGLRATIRADFERDVAPASSALGIATGIIEGFLRQLTGGEKEKVGASLVTGELKEIEELASRRIGGEKDKRGDKAFFATRLCGVALLMAGRMAGVGAIRRTEYEHLASEIERELGMAEGALVVAFAPR